ncbi:HYC_CC_PP family protein [Aequorivita marina]|uniref:HYC_CC_PP family protein n=1 Tax=Aequorivita marina TaxID=3073654 RepID=UPI002875D28F|nr:hypothetical protein [Aequorivita sp. S2608]MDS1298219.1 hypothetical protein [Aequorivita sp. S2608]
MRKAISIFLSVLMLASSSGLAYAQHFCGGMEMASKVTLGEKELSCGMDLDVPILDCKTGADVPEDHDCCKNHVTRIQTDDSFAKSSFDLKFGNKLVATFVSVFQLHQVEIAPTQKIFFADYTPPPLERDLNILYETFLI